MKKGGKNSSGHCSMQIYQKEGIIVTAKEYLQEIRKLDIAINQKQIEYDTLKKSRTYIGGMDYSDERVQTSPDGSGFTKISDRLADMQRDINNEIDQFHDMRHERIGQIQQLSKAEYTQILFKRYVEYKSLETVASEMVYSYHRACHIHGEALCKFEEIMKDSNK